MTGKVMLKQAVRCFLLSLKHISYHESNGLFVCLNSSFIKCFSTTIISRSNCTVYTKEINIIPKQFYALKGEKPGFSPPKINHAYQSHQDTMESGS